MSFRSDVSVMREKQTASLNGVYPKIAGEPPLNAHKPLLERHEFAEMGLVMAEHPG